MNDKFLPSDAWILLAVIYAGSDGGDRVRISDIADYINHAVPTDIELDGALARLERAVFVVRDGDKFKASSSVLEAYSRTHTPRRGIHKEMEDALHFLNTATN